ncbi:hypothetical protein H8K35_14905 [Undibacterium sp. LX40W]|uniref:Uncharacterized protein n=1 Tax=Undibacterium nitidum TaxID=2762298 RepID=A0A923HNK8_9BURK|nr:MULTISPECIES: hypothetical protein [Undibacterium]MBC3882679.1 hypothetical protein [Undibacterium nitidum]MBC3892960.1 hypothetical protein [Undibacterium sp. LX40W]
MAATDKDLLQKRKAIRYCVALGIVPFYEVNVTNVKDLTDKPELLTDIDVLGIDIKNGRLVKSIFDCKTTKTSPINRAFWAAGLREYIDAQHAFVILKRSAPESHKISARTLLVHLYDETLFDAHATALSALYLEEDDYLFDMDRWHALYECFRANQTFEKLGDFLRHSVPLELDAARAVRGILNTLRAAKGELDPAKNSHVAIYCYALFNFCLAMSVIVRDVFDVFDPKQSREQFQTFLRDYIWGGRESYQLRKKLQLVMAAQNAHVSPEFELHAWPDFVELTRTLLDSPESVFYCATPLLSCALRTVHGSTERFETRLKEQFSKNNRQRQFSFRLSSYLITAAGLPREFDDRMKTVINNVLE